MYERLVSPRRAKTWRLSPPLNAPLIIISPEFPPRRGGVADHTVELARGLSARRDVTVLTSLSGALENGFRVSPTVSNWQSPRAVLNAIRQLPVGAEILWQYVPQMYGRGGFNPGLATIIKALSQAGRAQCLIAHEIEAPLSWWPHRMFYALAHRYQWRQILRYVDVIGISTEAWLDDYRRRAPAWQTKLFLAPSPSNIAVVATSPDQRQVWRRKNGLESATQVIACFGNLNWPEQFAWIRTAWIEAQTTLRRVGLVAVGDLAISAAVPGGLKPLFKLAGYLSAAEVSAVLQAADVLALPYVDGVAERRTTFMAGLSHGCAVITTFGHSTGLTLRQGKFFWGVEVDQKQRFVDRLCGLLADDALRAKLGQAARETYEQRYAWPKLIETIEEKLARIRRLRPVP